MVVTTSTKPTVQIRTDKTWVRSHPLRDGIHDESLDLEAIQTVTKTTAETTLHRMASEPPSCL